MTEPVLYASRVVAVSKAGVAEHVARVDDIALVEMPPKRPARVKSMPISCS
jgi:hypothetical protein